MLPNYKVLTSKSILDINTENETETMALWEEQSSLLPKANIFYVHVFEDKHYMDEHFFTTNNIEDEIQILAIKDGVDLVQFENGNIGFVAYYNGHKNGLNFQLIIIALLKNTVWRIKQ